MIDSLPLSDVLARRLNLEWYDGVAIVRAVAERLLEQHGAAVRIPELHQIELAADGSVAIAGGLLASEPVRRLGQILQAMLTDAEVPVQMRLIVSQATAPIPSYSTLAELDQALAYFERPGRAGLLAGLFARAQAAGPVTAATIALTLDRIAPLSEAQPAGVPPTRQRRNVRRLIGIAAAALVVLAISGAAVLYARTVGTTLRGREVSHATGAAADAVGAIVLAGVSAVSDSVGLGRLVAADTPAPPPAAPAALRTAPERRARAARRAAAGEPVSSGDRSVPRTIVVYDAPDALESVNEVPAGAEIVHLSLAAPIDDLEVYAPGAEGVLPPVGLRAQLPRRLPPTVDPTSLSRIELVIARDGTVESARLLGARRDVQGGMFLSAAKAWEFWPAMKDGLAVRYRKTILVSFE
jgi:hypothetical protein